MNAPLLPPALDEIRAHEAEMVEIRRRIHSHPELAYEENATADLVAERLERWGYEVHRGLGGQQHAPHRPARRHGRAAHPGDQRQALGQQGVRQDARLRP
jgi:metal-dependent amidase/aminoacylase/carboxypeptidase family protein